MLTPEQLKALPERMRAILDSVEEDIIKDIARRIAKTGTITPTARWQIRMLAENAVEKQEITDRIAKLLNIGTEEISKIFDDAGTISYEQEAALYAQAGVPMPKPEAMKPFINAAKKQTLSEFVNITKTLAFKGIGIRNFYDKITLDTANAYIASLDKATTATASGAFTLQESVKRSVKEMTDMGLQTIMYESGHIDRIDVATMRAVRTGLSQAAKEVTRSFIDENGVELVEVSAHAGARPDHAEWQGGVYYVDKPINDYRSLVDVTGLGTVTGLAGANCRHSYMPFWHGISEPTYTKEELEQLKNATVEYNGKEIPLYEANQKQRSMERAIRKTKREILAFDTIHKENPSMVDVNELSQLSVKLKTQRAIYKDFSNKTGLIQRNERHQVQYFGRKEASRARGAAKLQEQIPSASNIKLTKNEIINEIKEYEWRNALNSEQQSELNKFLDLASEDELKIFQKFGKNAQIKFGTQLKSGGGYRPSQNIIELNLTPVREDNEVLGLKNNIRAIFHEFGHYVDANMYGIPTKLDMWFSASLTDYQKIVENDFVAYYNKLFLKQGLKEITNLNRLNTIYRNIIQQDIRTDAHIKSGISDILDAATNGSLNEILPYGHGARYWKRMPDRLPQIEGLANMFDVMITKDKALEEMKKYLPNAYEYVIKRFLGAL